MSYRQYTDPEVTIRKDYITVSDGVGLRVIDFIPRSDTDEQPLVVFVAGWISQITGWKEVLKQLTRRYHTIYIETREKESARLPDDTVVEFSVDRMSRDLHELLDLRITPGRPFYIVGSSLGSTIILEYLHRYRRLPCNVFLIAPNCEFPFPPWFIFTIQHLPVALYPPIKYVLKWYLRNFMLDRDKEPEQVKKYEGTIDAAEPKRLRDSALALKDYNLWDKLPQIMAPALIIGAKTDTLHGVNEIEKMAHLMPAAKFTLMESNKETHSEKAGALIVDAIHNDFGRESFREHHG